MASGIVSFLLAMANVATFYVFGNTVSVVAACICGGVGVIVLPLKDSKPRKIRVEVK